MQASEDTVKAQKSVSADTKPPIGSSKNINKQQLVLCLATMSTPHPEDSLIPEIQRLRSLHQAIGDQLRHIEQLQSLAHQDAVAQTQTRPTPNNPKDLAPRLTSEAYAATLRGTPAVGMTWASLCSQSMNEH